MNNPWLAVIFGVATAYFGVPTFRVFPVLLRLILALGRGAVKWPGPIARDPDPKVREGMARLGVRPERLFPAFIRSALELVAAFGFFLMSLVNELLIVVVPREGKALCLLVLTSVALIGGIMASRRALSHMESVRTLLAEIASKNELRQPDGRSAEAESAIEHPLIGKQSQSLDNAKALSLFFDSLRYLQDGNEEKGSTSYQEALRADPSLHTHARDALSKMIQGCCPEDEGAIYYWLGIHSEYLKDAPQAASWYAKAVEAFHKMGHQKRESKAHCNLGKVKMQLGDPAAMAEYEQASALDPMNGIAHINRGTAYYIADEHERALDAFAEAIWADPERYGPEVTKRLQRFGYTWREDLEQIGQRVAKKQGLDLDMLNAGERESILQAEHCFQTGNGFFQSRRYQEALAQFEKGKLLSRQFPGNFLGVSMTAMQMIELGAIPEDQIPHYLEKAEQNIDECLRIAPNHADYLSAKSMIRGYRKK